MNEQCTKAEYERRLAEVFPLTRASVADFRGALLQARREVCVHPPMFGMKNEDVSGNHIYESKGIVNPAVRAEVYITLNGAPSQLLFDSELDLVIGNGATIGSPNPFHGIMDEIRISKKLLW